MPRSDLHAADPGVENGVAIFRAGAWVWMVIVVVVSRDHLLHPGPAMWLVGAAGVVTALGFAIRRLRVRSIGRALATVAELCVGSSLLLADTYVYDGREPQSLGSVWPIAGPLAAGVGFGPWAGAASGVALGLSRLGSPLVGRDIADLSAVSSAVLYGLAGGVWGWVGLRLRRARTDAERAADADRQLGIAKERSETAAALHDGVLQSLAVIQRRSNDPELIQLARRQEADLRSFLTKSGPSTDLLSRCRDAATRHASMFDNRVEVVCTDDLGGLAEPTVAAVAGAVVESLNNAGKHAEATKIVVYLELDDELFCSVKDDGIGFDPEHASLGMGIDGSVRRRIAEVGGRVHIDSTPGSGTDVKMWVP